MSTVHLEDSATGRWLIETSSGSRHLFDLDRNTYARYSDRPVTSAVPNPTGDIPLLDIEQMPRINSQFRVVVAADSVTETVITSSYVTRIVPLKSARGLVDLTELTVLEQVAQAPPANAWLLLGDEASFPTDVELREQRDPINPALEVWTCPRQITRGDLVLVYFTAPRRAVHFVARALEAPIYDPDSAVNALKRIDRHQWWTTLSPLVPIPPVPYRTLRDLNGGYLNLKGKPTTYLTPETVDAIVAGLGDLDNEQQLVLQTPTGEPDLPDPSTIGLTELRGLAAGALSPETKVEQYVVRPLLDLCFPADAGYQVTPQVRIGRAGIADYGILYGTSLDLVGVVEAKIGVRRLPDGGMTGSPDLDQVLRYAIEASTPGILIDANDIFLVDPGSTNVASQYERKRLTQLDLDRIAAHIHEAATQ